MRREGGDVSDIKDWLSGLWLIWGYHSSSPRCWLPTSHPHLALGSASDCLHEAKYQCPRSLLEDWLAKNWAGVVYRGTEGSTCMTGGNAKPLRFLELVANTSSWNHMN